MQDQQTKIYMEKCLVKLNGVRKACEMLIAMDQERLQGKDHGDEYQTKYASLASLDTTNKHDVACLMDKYFPEMVALNEEYHRIATGGFAELLSQCVRVTARTGRGLQVMTPVSSLHEAHGAPTALAKPPMAFKISKADKILAKLDKVFDAEAKRSRKRCSHRP